MKRFWQFIPVPPRQWLARFGLLVGLFVVLLLAGGTQLPPRETPAEKVALCSEPNKWLALVDRYLGTNLAEAQAGPCVVFTPQCRGPYDAYPGFNLAWNSLGFIPQNWRAQVVVPGIDLRPGIEIPAGELPQVKGPGFIMPWGDVSPMSADPPLVLLNAQGLPVDSYGNRISDSVYYRAAVQFQSTGIAQCADRNNTNDGDPSNDFPNCLVKRTRDFTDTRPGYGMRVTAVDCPWQQIETTPDLSIQCDNQNSPQGPAVIYTSGLNSPRGGTTNWELVGGSLSPGQTVTVISSDLSHEPYTFNMSDGSTVTLKMVGSAVVASRSSGPCNPPPPELSCTLTVTPSSWQSSSTPVPQLSWSTGGGFRDNVDTLQLTEIDTASGGTLREASTNRASSALAGGPVNLNGLPRVRPSDPSKTLKYTGEVSSTDGSAMPGYCETTLTITAERRPEDGGVGCVGGCSPTASCNFVDLTWSPVPNASKYRIYTYNNPTGTGEALRINDVAAPATSFRVTPLAENSTYTFRRQTFDNLENSSPISDPPVTATTPACTGAFPTPPTLSLAAGPACTQMTLTWTDAGSETGYEVWRKRVSPPVDPDFTRIASLAANILTYLDSGLAGSASYSYYVVANAPGGSATSNTATRATDSCVGADFTISAVPASRTVNPGQSTTYTVTIASTNLPNTDIALGVTGLPAGATASFAPNPVRTPAADGSVTSTLTINTTAATPLEADPGYPLTISGTGASINKSTSVNLVVETGGGPNNPPSASGGPPTTGLMCSLPPLLTFAFTYTDPDSDPASQFSFQVDNDADFSSPIVDRQNQPSSVASGGTITQLVEVRAGGGSGVLDYNRTYYWRAKVWDNRGADSGWMSAVSFTSPSHAYPQPDFTASATTITVGVPIDFIDQSAIAAGYSIARWLWNFGSDVQSATVTAPPIQPADQDGNPNNNTVTQSPPPNRTQPHVTYSAAGAKTVSLSVRDSSDFECTRTKTLFGGSGTSLNWKEIIPQ